jgi:Asp-tRNA(Asn)/Glu-tRNA(Gln) amidotransferase A subunit family amidase
VKVLKRAGAIIFVKSNVPQYAMAFDSHNYIFGRVQNPRKAERIAGGSSGGEAALIVSGCSAIGLGADHFGSVRIPAALCGCVAFRATNTRLSFKGHTRYNAFFEGQMAVLVSKSFIIYRDIFAIGFLKNNFLSIPALL